MTVQSVYLPPQYYGDGTTRTFPFPFTYFEPADIAVTLYNGTLAVTVSPRPVLGGSAVYDYTLTGTQDTSGTSEYLYGSVTFNAAPPAGYLVTITRAVPVSQNTTIANYGPFPAKTVEASLDRLTAEIQESNAKIARCLQLPNDAASSGMLPTGRANQVLSFDASGNPTVTPLSQSAVKLTLTFNVQDYGAKGDGLTDDAAAIQRAINAASAAGGGTVYCPATGSPYVVGTGCTVPSGVNLVGDGQPAWYGADQPWQNWPKTGGAWFQPTDLVNPAFTVAGVGCKLRGLNFVHNQPAPSSTPGTAYTPTTYPYCIRVTQNFVGIEDIHIVNATHGIAWDYTGTSGGGTYCYMRNIFSGALVIGTWFHNVNDTMHISNCHERNLFYCDNSNIQTYTETHKWGWHFNYIDNPLIDGVEFFQCMVGIQCTDSTVNAGGFNLTHACVLAQITNIDFNLCVQAINLATNLTTFTAIMTNVVAQSDTVTNRAAGYFFNLASDNVNVMITNLWAPEIGNSLMAIGGGTAGLVQIANLRVDWYGQLANNSMCFNVGAGAYLDVPTGMQNVVRKFGAGAKVLGVGAVQSPLEHANLYADREGGTVGVIASASGDDASGYVAFYNTASVTRRGYVGHCSTSLQEMNVTADIGPVYLTCPGGTWQHNTDGSTVFINSTGARKWRIDASGNMVLAGTLTQSGTP